MSSHNPEKRWRRISRATADSPGWRNDVQSLALELHDAAARLAPQRLRAFGFEILSRLAERVADEAEQVGSRLSDSEIDDIACAASSRALDLVDTFPAVGQLS